MQNNPTQNNPTWVAVVAAALLNEDGTWLMHRRPPDKQHGGLWEFPGGKVEPGEHPVMALIRELEEELGIIVQARDLTPVTFAHDCASASTDADASTVSSGGAIVIFLYILRKWEGEVCAREGGVVSWFTPADIANLPKPPLDLQLVERLLGEKPR